jgi:hypothetical protein
MCAICPSIFFSAHVPNFFLTVDMNSVTGKESSQTSMFEHWDECLKAGRGKLNCERRRRTTWDNYSDHVSHPDPTVEVGGRWEANPNARLFKPCEMRPFVKRGRLRAIGVRVFELCGAT